MSAKRKYGYAFLDHGFVNMPSQGIDRPQCVICHKVLTNESLKKSKLVDHLTTRHPLLKEKDREYFEGKAKQLRDIQFGSTSSSSQRFKAAVEVSFDVAYQITRNGKNHTIVENLIMPCAKLMVPYQSSRVLY